MVSDSTYKLLSQMAEVQESTIEEVILAAIESSTTKIEDHVRNLYNNQKSGSIARGHSEPAYTYEELLDWVISQDNFISLYSIYKLSGCDRYMAPSIDRIDETRGYSFDNIRLVTWRDNVNRSYSDRKEGIGKSGEICVAVNKYDLNGTYLCTYHSFAAAARDLPEKKSTANIAKACQEGAERKSVGGFMFRLASEGNNDIQPYRKRGIRYDKAVIAIHKKSGVTTKFSSIVDASEYTGVKTPSILRVCNNTRDSSKGYIFKFTE